MHFLTPWLISWALRSKMVPIGRLRPGVVNLLYPSITIGLGASAGTLMLASFDLVPAMRSPVAQVLVGALVGLVLPLGVTLLSQRSGHFRCEVRAYRTATITGVSGVAEEVLWRLAGVSGMLLMDIPWIPALVIAGCGFLLLHIPLYGVKRLPYLAVFTVLITMLFALLGPLACTSAHLVHNSYLALTGGQQRRATRPPPASSVSSTPW